MQKNNDISAPSAAALGVAIGCAVSLIVSTLPFSSSEKYRVAKQECEKSLPRDQYCVIVAVPEKK